jgi:ketosteroid isomerase-like protein
VSPPGTSANANLATMQRFVSAVLAGEAATLHEVAAPDFVLYEGSGMPFAGSYQGIDGFLRFLGIFGETLEIEVLAPVRSFVSDDPDVIAAELEVRGTNRATGRRFESSLVEVWTFRDGKVASIKAHYFNVPQRT